VVGELFGWVVSGRAGSVYYRIGEGLLVRSGPIGAVLYLDSLAFLLDRHAGQLVFAFASEMYDTVVYVFF
jgi:hypothetical protein